MMMDSATQEPDEKFDFNSPEDVLIEVIEDLPNIGYGDWKGFSIDSCTVINGSEGVTGAASYERSYGGFLDYTIEGMIDFPGAGWFVVEGVTGEYVRGDGYTSDDDMRFYYKSVRPATEDEIKLA